MILRLMNAVLPHALTWESVRIKSGDISAIVTELLMVIGLLEPTVKTNNVT